MSMIYQDSSSFGKEIPIYVRYRVLVDSTKEVDTTCTIYAGRPVTLSNAAAGTIQPYYCGTCDAPNVKVYGLSMFQKNTYLDEVTGTMPSGIYGSYRGSVLLKGIADVGPNVFTLTDGSTCTIANYITESYKSMCALYVHVENDACQGMITMVCDNSGTGQNDGTFVGYVMNYDSTNCVLQVLLP